MANSSSENPNHIIMHLSREEEEKYFEPGAAKEFFKLPQFWAGNEAKANIMKMCHALAVMKRI